VTSLTWVFRLRRIVRLTATKPTIKNPRFRHRLEEFRIAEDNEGVLETAALPRKPESDTLPDVAERNAGDVFSRAAFAETAITGGLDFAKVVFAVNFA